MVEMFERVHMRLVQLDGWLQRHMFSMFMLIKELISTVCNNYSTAILRNIAEVWFSKFTKTVKPSESMS